MRLFVVSVLSLLAASSGVYAAAVAGYPYRAELLAYSPARGEFAAVNALTPDYTRYINQRAPTELFGYRYPEPIESRRITYEEYLNQLAKGTLKDETELIKKRDEHFRLWAVHVYDQYRQELDHLKVAGKEPTADMLAKINAFEAVLIAPKSDYSQETSIIKQLREEHLRFWNESRRKAMLALQQEEQAVKSKIYSPDAGEKLFQNAPTQAVFLSETAEQKKAREEHLRIYQEQHLREFEETLNKVFVAPLTSENAPKLAAQQPVFTQTLQQSAPAANNEKLATAKSSLQIDNYQSQPQVYAGVQETAEVQRAREEHLKLVKEANLKASLTSKTEKVQTETEVKPLLYDASTDKLAEEQFADEEAHLRAEEAKQREAELLAETERLREEQRLQAEELLRLQQEEQRRQEQERLDQSNENKEAVHYAEKPQLPIAAPAKDTLESLIQSQYQFDPAATYDIRETEKYAGNPYLLRYAVPGGNVKQIGTPIATTAYYIGAQEPAQQQQVYANPGVYYLRDANEGYLKLDNPYFLHYITNQQGGKDTLATADAASLASALAALHQAQKIEQPIAATFGQKPIAPSVPIAPVAPSGPLASLAPAAPILPIAPLVPNADNMKIVYGNDAALAALEKATREHFRAHEIALEHLRLANQKQSPLQKDCY
ncbi:trichohyalin [Bactrocera neohumeralis]|uniref:trichohyalin n=1 Tax=Bactrocera neohumeralis TaxID=98809 RepID=UPI002166AC39|nr:trichohyalin [Bactrocera neohumeralis]